MQLPAGLYGALFLTGVLGSLGHCLGMCGPLVIMATLQFKSRGLRVLPSFVSYHAARAAVYAALGALAGGIGSLLGLGHRLTLLAGGVGLVLGMAVIVLGLGYLGWLPFGRIESANAWLTRAMSGTLRRRGRWGAPMLGALNGLLPCGLVYSSLLVAAGTGSAAHGALGMLVFASGTVPALLGVALGAGALRLRPRAYMARAAGVLIVIVGIQLALRGSAGLGVVPHLMLGSFMVW